jgi:hypothetical protein
MCTVSLAFDDRVAYPGGFVSFLMMLAVLRFRSFIVVPGFTGASEAFAFLVTRGFSFNIPSWAVFLALVMLAGCAVEAEWSTVASVTELGLVALPWPKVPLSCKVVFSVPLGCTELPE